MKVLLVANGFPPRGRYGTEFYAGELARALIARGHQVVAFCPGERDGGGGRVGRELAAHGAELVVVHAPQPRSRALEHAWRDPFVEASFSRLLEEERPDVVHFLQLAWGLSFELPPIARAARVRTVLTLTDYGLLCHRGQMFDWRAERCGGPHPPATCARCLRRPAAGTASRGASAIAAATAGGLALLDALVGGATGVVTTGRVAEREAGAARALAAVDRVVAPTSSLAVAFGARLVPPPTVLPYAFDVAAYACVERIPEPGHARFAFMGQLAPHKGPDVALRAFAIARDRLAARGVRAQLQLFGAAPSGRFESFARALIDDLPEGARIEPAFEPGDAPKILAHVDAVVVPSLWDENAPLVCLEARAAGVPIAGSRVPGIVEVVEEGVHGRLADPGDAQGLADALEGVLDAPPVPRSLPVDLDAHVEQVLALYRTP